MKLILNWKARTRLENPVTFNWESMQGSIEALLRARQAQYIVRNTYITVRFISIIIINI